MKRLITILIILNVSIILAQNSEKYFQFTDSIFNTGQIKELEIEYQISGGSYPLKESLSALDSIVDFLKINNMIKIEIGTHTDYRGHDEYNKILSEARAKKVTDYLIYKGIDSDRIESVGYGESEPIEVDELINKKSSFLAIGSILNKEYCDNQPDEEKKEIVCKINRRTTLKILSIKD